MSFKYDLKIEGMTCASCVTRVEKVISKIDGIKNVSVNLATEKVSFEMEDEKRNLSEIAAAIKEYGYELKLNQKSNTNEKTFINEEKDTFYSQLKFEFVFALILTVPIFLLSMLMEYEFFNNFWWLSGNQTRNLLLILTTPVIFISGKRFFKIFWNNLLHYSAEMNSLVAIGTGAAYGYSILATLFPELLSISANEIHVYYETAAVIITLILMGKIFEHKAKNKTAGAIKKLLELKPKNANVLVNGNEIQKDISALSIDDIVIIKPGENIPADGIIISGISSVNESMLTGESIPVDKEAGSDVIGGTINNNGSFNFKVTKVGDNSVLGQVIRLVENAQSTKPPIQKLVDKIASVFVPIVIVIAIITFISWLVLSSENSFSTALINFVAVLIIACPCALGLATPTAIMVGTGLGASNGILIRNGESLEIALKIDTIVIDKTGTITEGKPEVSQIITFNYDESELIKYAASLESKSEHPLAHAVEEKAKTLKIEVLEPSSFQSHSGFGIDGQVNNEKVLIGKKSFLQNSSIKTEIAEDSFNYFSAQGKTVIYVAINGELKGLIIIEDKLKIGSNDAIENLKKMNIRPVMITGDNKNAALFIAEKVGLKEFRADVYPQDKSEIVKQFQSEGRVIGMVGDGINDAPALAQADVGIAIGTGTDVAIESSQITLVKGDLRGVVKAINLSKKTLQTIKQNLFWAFVYNIILIPLAAFGMLNPMIAAFAMSLSSVSVVTNSLRLKGKKI